MVSDENRNFQTKIGKVNFESATWFIQSAIPVYSYNTYLSKIRSDSLVPFTFCVPGPFSPCSHISTATGDFRSSFCGFYHRYAQLCSADFIGYQIDSDFTFRSTAHPLWKLRRQQYSTSTFPARSWSAVAARSAGDSRFEIAAL